MFPKIELIGLDNPDVRGAAIEVPGRREPIYVLPFPKHGLKQAFTLSDRVVLFVAEGEYRNLSRQLLVAKFDTETEKITQAATLGVPGSSLKLQLSRDRRWLYCTGLGITSIDVDTLTIWRAFDIALLHDREGKLAKRSDFFSIDPEGKHGDARVFHSQRLRDEFLDPSTKVATLDISHLRCEMGPTHLVMLNGPNLLKVDLESGGCRYIGISGGKESEKYERNLILLSASGDFPVSKVTSEIPFSSGTGEASHAAFGYDILDIGSHFDAQRDGVKRFGLVLDYWDLSCNLPRALRHIVRMATAAELNLIETWHHLPREALTDSEFEKGLVFETVRRANPRDRELLAHHPERRSVALEKDVKIRLPYDINSKALSGYIRDVFDEPRSGGYWVLFSDCSLRRVSQNGALGPLISLTPASPRWTRHEIAMDFEPDGSIRLTREGVGTYWFDPSRFDPQARRVTIDVTEPAERIISHREAFKAFVRKNTVNVVVLKDWSLEACAMALREQRMRIDSQFESLVAGSQFAKSLEFRYVVGDQNYEEAEFFQLLVDQRANVAQELRALLTTYLKKIGAGGEGGQPWKHGGSGTPALGHAMRALVLLDPDALDVFRVFLAKRDGEHEGYCRDTILPDYVRTHGWRNRKALRFGIYFTFNMLWGGGGCGPINGGGLMTAASCMVSPKEFVDLVTTEASALRLDPLWNDQDEGYYLSCFYTGLDKADPFQAAVGEALARRRPDLASKRNA